jgi:hypothetical protein
MSRSSVASAWDIHIGYLPPERWDELADRDARARQSLGGHGLRPGLTSEAVAWESLHMTPRWIGDDSSAAVAAIEPSLTHNLGASEWQRFIAGARSRGEVALAISMIGHPRDSSIVNFAGVLSGTTESVTLPGASHGFGSVGGARIALANPPVIADGLGRADRDLAMRLAGTRDLTLDWWSLLANGVAVFPGSGGPAQTVDPGGSVRPLLVSGAGEVVAAVWISSGEDIRHYVLPWMSAWAPVLDWLRQRAIPEFLPAAARRIYANLVEDPALQTAAESSARSALAELDEDYRVRREKLEQTLCEAEAAADDLRGDLLFGSSAVLEGAVSRVFREAGCTVTVLDELFGKTVSADLLVEYHGRRRLVEVKSATGNAAESLVNAARKHLDTWPALRPDLDVETIVLIVNHQTNYHPGDRSAQAYTRAEFVDSLAIPVTTTSQLFHAWRRGDLDAIREAVFGEQTAPRVGLRANPTPPPPEPDVHQTSWWRRRGKR